MGPHKIGPWFAYPKSLQVADKRFWFAEGGSRHGETPNMLIDCMTEAECHLIAAAPDLLAAAEAAVAYDRAIHQCANDPGRMSSFCTADGDDLDALYAKWISLSRAAIAKAKGESK